MRFFFLVIAFFATVLATAQTSYLFIGTYTSRGSKGIYVYRFDAKNGRLKWVSNTEGITNPSYLAVAPDNRFIYSCTDTRTSSPGSISAFSFDAKAGKLSLLNKQQTDGANPVYIAVHKTGRWVVEGNYTSGNLCVLGIRANGCLQPPSQTIEHS
ncbi:MAG TPA: beta-propeller fold lactonase family protein, partial [Flavisolibacter sp.]|nr:beta-propeller fold lactonase family protein [Flavisolibacter sp.]